MVERRRMTLRQILRNFPPRKESFNAGKNGKVVDGKVAYRVYRDPKELILYAVPEAEWVKMRKAARKPGLGVKIS